MRMYLLCLTLALLGCGVRNTFAEDAGLTIGPRREAVRSAAEIQRDSAERIQAHMREMRKLHGENSYIGGSWILDDTNYILVTGYGRRIERQYYGQRVRLTCSGTGGNGVNMEVITITDLRDGKVLETIKFEDKIQN